MGKYFIWIHYERLHNHNKAKHNETVCIFLGINCNAILLSWRATHLVCSAFLVAAQCCVLAHSRWEMILRRLLLDIFNHNWTLFNFIVYWGITWLFISIKPALGRSLNVLAYSDGGRVQAFYDIFMTAVVVYATGLWHIASLLHIFALITADCE